MISQFKIESRSSESSVRAERISSPSDSAGSRTAKQLGYKKPDSYANQTTEQKVSNRIKSEEENIEFQDF